MQPLLLTMGDPTGIGPELIVKALLDGSLNNLQRDLQIVGDVGVLCCAARIYNCSGKPEKIDEQLYSIQFGDRELKVQALTELEIPALRYGCPDQACGKAMAAYVEYAIARCLDGTAAGMVTCPINKAAINAAGYPFPGHTELLAERCKRRKVVMMLTGNRLKVCLVTTHLAYRDVPGQLTQKNILDTIRISARGLQEQFAIAQPRIAVLALNPHAGESGLFGDEEARIIAPAIAQARAEGLSADGPHSADTLFHFASNGAYDAVVCMYHDQGLIPLKLLHFDDAVNVTLGLPIIRTSVDHGTAYDLAGTGQANTASLVAAINLAGRMANSHSRSDETTAERT